MENRIIKIEYNYDNCSARIVEQSHRRKDFVPPEYDDLFPNTGRYRRRNGLGQHFFGPVGKPTLELCSEGSPHNIGDMVYMRGRYEDSDNTTIGFNDRDQLEQFILSVAMYNATFNIPSQIKLSDIDFREEWKW